MKTLLLAGILGSGLLLAGCEATFLGHRHSYNNARYYGDGRNGYEDGRYYHRSDNQTYYNRRHHGQHRSRTYSVELDR
jgi:hypothetical protein